MSNLRVLYKNIFDSSNAVTASSTSGSLSVNNLKTERKGEVHRSIGTSVSYEVTWSSPQKISSLVIPACNLSSAATIQVRLWDAETAGTLLLDTGANLACQGQSITNLDIGTAITASHFSLGIMSKVLVWFTKTDLVRRVTIDIVDSSNPAGFIDVARLIIGDYWSPNNNASYGAEVSLQDMSEVARTDSGGVTVYRSSAYETLSFSLEFMNAADRKELDRITRINSVHKPILVSLIPDGTDYSATQETTIYGFRKLNPISILISKWQSSIVIDSW